MNFLSFFRKTEKTGKDSTVDSQEIAPEATKSSGENEIETALSLHPSWNIPQEQQYVFRFLSNDLDPLKPNQISLSGIDVDVEPANGSWLVKAFFRSSLDQTIQIGTVELMLLDENEKLLASQEFDLSELGDIPAKSARPWIFEFKKDNLLADEPPAENWKLAFNVQSMVPHRLDLEKSWEEGLTKEQKDSLEKVVEGLPKLKPREVNISGFQVKTEENGSLAASIFIRNGHSKEINIEQLPLELIDANGDLVARGSFKLDQFSVKANTTKPWTFIYPKEMVQKTDADLSRWIIRVPQQNA
ncbi:accessory Sec system S-layer assembly protein [Sporosarcina ureilytica]|uniref:Accessory Sec system S-layer assembly protein n=1 Tax=Sporosarcina ureilytica TaxID=298596 RepID=A0A1D8JJ79_9BACL|nr:accessory Sec system S-layer assembly protein [Sporosarcina ureilytica]AOV08755.1 accessory Sec system S-layer assembly protein [Sporosarcina ureilytica]